jgi:hypothetical protein
MKLKTLLPTILPLSALAVILAVKMISCKSEVDPVFKQLQTLGLQPQAISSKLFFEGTSPVNFKAIAGAAYKPSYNDNPSIPAQCWIETGYGTQNACKYCHTNYLTSIKHGNAFPLAEDQILYSFPTPNLNKILWQNILHPQKIDERILADGLAIPDIEDVDYIRYDNWTPYFTNARKGGNADWINRNAGNPAFMLFPALNPNHLFPLITDNPTRDGTIGYIDAEGFVRDEKNKFTGWRAINFFPYAIFTPLTGSVSGIYIRLPQEFMTVHGKFEADVYKQNLDLLEKNIKNKPLEIINYVGDASNIAINKGFYPVGTEFAHPLHYVDLQADGQTFEQEHGTGEKSYVYNFPGTRSKRVKEIRYMYKWKEVSLDDIADVEEETEEPAFAEYIGNEGQGWVDNGAGWILSAYIENRAGELRPQTTEELAQCIGCHGQVGNTVDAVWSFQRKLPGELGWKDMNYGEYDSRNPNLTKLHDYIYEQANMGELGYFYYTVVGGNLYGVMPAEIRSDLHKFAVETRFSPPLGITLSEILNDEILKNYDYTKRKPLLLERQRLMRQYADSKAYLLPTNNSGDRFISGTVFYPTVQTMKSNILGYRKIVLDQSFNLGKDVFGTGPEAIPFTFRSDGRAIDEFRNQIATGNVITSRPYDSDGVGIWPTGIVSTNHEGKPIDNEGNVIDIETEAYKLKEHISNGGTFEVFYNPMLSDKPVR